MKFDKLSGFDIFMIIAVLGAVIQEIIATLQHR